MRSMTLAQTLLSALGSGAEVGEERPFPTPEALPLDLHLFEQHPYLGGRVQSFSFPGPNATGAHPAHTFELGADVWTTFNYNIAHLARLSGLALDPPVDSDAEESDDPADPPQSPTPRPVWVWNGTGGTEFSFGSLRGPALADTLRTIGRAEDFKRQLLRNYLARASGRVAFTELADFLAWGNFAPLLGHSLAEELERIGVSRGYVEEACAPVSRVIYEQGSEIHAFLGLVALVNADQVQLVRDGNVKLVEWLARESRAAVHTAAKVRRVSPDAPGAASPGFRLCVEKGGSGSCEETERFDVVVLAGPVEWTGGLDWALPGGEALFGPKRPYFTKSATFVAAEKLNATFFGLPAETRLRGVLTPSLASEAGVRFYSIVARKQSLADGKEMFKIFSADAVTDAEVGAWFVGGSVVERRAWPYSFPRLPPHPPLQHFNPYPGIYYLNAIESVAVAMEGSVIAAKNVAHMIAFNATRDGQRGAGRVGGALPPDLPWPQAPTASSFSALHAYLSSVLLKLRTARSEGIGLAERALGPFFAPLAALEAWGGPGLALAAIAILHGAAHAFLQLSWSFMRYPSHYVHHLLLMGAAYTLTAALLERGVLENSKLGWALRAVEFGPDAELAAEMSPVSNAVVSPLVEVFAGLSLGVGLILSNALTPVAVLGRALFKNDPAALAGVVAAPLLLHSSAGYWLVTILTLAGRFVGGPLVVPGLLSVAFDSFDVLLRKLLVLWFLAFAAYKFVDAQLEKRTDLSSQSSLSAAGTMAVGVLLAVLHVEGVVYQTGPLVSAGRVMAFLDPIAPRGRARVMHEASIGPLDVEAVWLVGFVVGVGVGMLGGWIFTAERSDDTAAVPHPSAPHLSLWRRFPRSFFGPFLTFLGVMMHEGSLVALLGCLAVLGLRLVLSDPSPPPDPTSPSIPAPTLLKKTKKTKRD